MAQIQVEATKICCPTAAARKEYNACTLRPFADIFLCASIGGCKIITGTKCPQGWQNDILENQGDAVNAYCKLGCVSSVCGAMTTLQISDASEIVNGAVEQCVNACSTFCTKESMNAVETA